MFRPTIGNLAVCMITDNNAVIRQTSFFFHPRTARMNLQKIIEWWTEARKKKMRSESYPSRSQGTRTKGVPYHIRNDWMERREEKYIKGTYIHTYIKGTTTKNTLHTTLHTDK